MVHAAGTWEREFEVISCRNPKEIPKLAHPGWFFPAPSSGDIHQFIFRCSLGHLTSFFGSKSGEMGFWEQCHFSKGQLFGLCGIKDFSWRVLWVSAHCRKETQNPSFMLQTSSPVESDTDFSYFHVCHILSACNRSFLHLTSRFYPLTSTEETKEKKGTIHILNRTNFQV